MFDLGTPIQKRMMIAGSVMALALTFAGAMWYRAAIAVTVWHHLLRNQRTVKQDKLSGTPRRSRQDAAAANAFAVSDRYTIVSPIGSRYTQEFIGPIAQAACFRKSARASLGRRPAL